MFLFRMMFSIAFAVLLMLGSANVRAEATRTFTTVDEAFRGWLEDTGLANLGGYGRYDEDRKAAETIAKGLREKGIALVPESRGSTWVWTWSADAEGDTGRCTMAAVLMAFEQRRFMGTRGIVDRPLEVLVRCKWVDVKMTFGDPARPSPKPGHDMVDVIQTAKPEGKVHMEWHQMFGFPNKDYTPAEGPRGDELTTLLFERARYTVAAASIGTERVRPAWEGLPIAQARDTRCAVEPGLSGTQDLWCSMLYEVDDPVTCASAALAGFTRRTLAEHKGGRVFGPKAGLAVAFRCKDGHHGLVRTTAADSLEMTFYRAGDQSPTWQQRAPLPTLIPAVATKSAIDAHKDALVRSSTASGRTADSRIAWFGAQLGFVAAWFGAPTADVDLLGRLDFAGILGGVAPNVSCDAAPKGGRGPRTCRANPAIDLGPMACAAVAWAVAGALPHVAKPPFAKRADIDLEIGCGPTMGRDETLLVQRRAAPNNRIAMTIAAPSFEAITGAAADDDCEDAFYGLACDDAVAPDVAWPARVWTIAAPDDPANGAALKASTR